MADRDAVADRLIARQVGIGCDWQDRVALDKITVDAEGEEEAHAFRAVTSFGTFMKRWCRLDRNDELADPI